MPKTICQGAEATISLSDDEKVITKLRTVKSYRLPTLDEKIRTGRTRREAKILEKAFPIIPVPKIFSEDEKTAKITMEFIQGQKLSSHLDFIKNAEKVCVKMGEQIAKLHDAGIIHGDLTTSNMILSPENKLYFIDFGLSFHSDKNEDKAVDLHLISQALEAKHFEHYQQFFSAVLKGYSKSPSSAQVLEQLEKVELRGRYKAKNQNKNP